MVAAARGEIPLNPMITVARVPDSTPSIVSVYALKDKGGLLAKIRYNRLLDEFSGMTCHWLQGHTRVTTPAFGPVEVDEVYIGVGRSGPRRVFSVRAVVGRDRPRMGRIARDFAACRVRLPSLTPCPIIARPTAEGAIALLSFVETPEGVALWSEKHFRLVSAEEMARAMPQRRR